MLGTESAQMILCVVVPRLDGEDHWQVKGEDVGDLLEDRQIVLGGPSGIDEAGGRDEAEPAVDSLRRVDGEHAQGAEQRADEGDDCDWCNRCSDQEGELEAECKEPEHVVLDRPALELVPQPDEVVLFVLLISLFWNRFF